MPLVLILQPQPIISPKISHIGPHASIIGAYQAEGVIAARFDRGEESPNTAGQRAS